MNDLEQTISTRPVTVLTGFLGAGKTTFLNALLKEKKDTRFAIIENEVGEIGIDGDLIANDNDSFTELNNGCICCSINNSFVETLGNLSKRTDWDELIIEATGVANPGGIITPFKQLDWMKKYFQDPHVICIADARNIEEQLQVSETAGSQLAFGNVVYLSKTDLVSGDEIDSISYNLHKMNPLSKIYKGDKNNIPVNELIKKVVTFRLPFQANKTTVPTTHTHDHFDSVSLSFDLPFDRDKLMSRLHAFILFQAKDVYRFKSIFHDPKSDNRLVAQSVMRTLIVEEGEPWKVNEEKKSVFVFIGKNLQAKGFERMLKQCVLK